MKAFFEELFEYGYKMNQNLITVMANNAEIISDHCISLQCHVLNAHQIWNFRIHQKENHFLVWQIHPIQTWKDIDQNNYEESLGILDKFDLAEPIQYKNSLGHIFTNTVRDILFHAINHSTYHRGQIASEFKKIGLKPLITDYIVYKRS